MKYRILVTGANGQLGSELRELSAKYTDYEFTFTDVAELDITNIDSLNAYFQSQPKFDFLINCAAYTAVDAAESNQELAFKLNTTAVDMLVEMAGKYGFFLIQISTDYVFDGEKNRPYDEEDVPIPSSIYGKTKNDAERLILYSDIRAIVIRTAWLYSTYGKNFVKSMIKYGTERDELNVVFDQVGTPTYAADLADAILQILPQLQAMPKPYTDLFHYTNEGVCSWYDFTQHILRHENINCRVNPIRSEQYPTPAKRPAFSVLDKSKIKTKFGITIPYWTDSLDVMLKKLKEMNN
ncbi:MAG: dTDP-4-dehydrorhamnose reductase [Salinivirgaceae bacterium]|nr:dTDP-4-dehydrorhamnose reductase [Salinivirgaceae bacterium]